MLPCLGGIVARNYSDDSSSDDELRSTKPIVAPTATLDGPRQSAAQHGFPKAARRALPTDHTTTNKASSPTTTGCTTSNNSSSAADGVSKSKGVHFDPSTKGPLTTTRPTPAASRSAAATSTAERPLSDEELSLMGWWVYDPVRRMDGAVETTMTPPSSAANDMDAIAPESGSQEWLSRRSTLMPMDKRLSTLVRCMQSSAPQHQRSFLAISRALLRSPKSNAGERLRKLFLIDGADSAMRWFRLFRIIEESSTGAYRHRGAITTPMPVVTEEALGLVGDLLRPYMTSPSGASFQSDLVSAEPMRAEHVAAQLVEVLNGEGKEDKPITAEALLMPPCPTFEEIGSLFTTTSSGDNDKSSSSERLEFEASSGAEKALMAGINLEEPITNTTIEAFTTACYNEGNDDSGSNAVVTASLASSPPVHKVVLALTHLAAPELILHLLTESFELSRSTSRSAVSIADNNAQSPLSIAALLRFALFLCEHHPLASHRFVLAELLPQTSNNANTTSSSQPPTSSTSAPRSTTLRLLDNLSGMFVEDYERLLMEEDPTTSNIPLGSLLDVMFLTGRLVGYLIPSAVATEQLSLQDTNNATDVLRMVAALSTSLLRKATDVIVMCVGLLGQLEGDLGLIGVADEVPATHTWLACWLTARTAVVHEALVEHERSARGGAAVDFASSSAASELLPLALRWTNRGSLILGSAVLQAHSGDENLEQQRNLGDVRLLSSAGEDVVGDPSGWMQSMVGAACGLLSAVTSSTSHSHNNTALEMYRRVAAVYLVAQYRKCKANTTSTLDIPSLLIAPLPATAKVSKDEAFSPLGKAMLAFVQNGLSAPSSPHRALTMSIAKDLVEELVARCEADEKKKSMTTTKDDDDFDFSDNAMMKDTNTATTTTAAIKSLALLLIEIGKLVESLLAPIARNINPVSTTTTTSTSSHPANSRKNALFALLGSMTPDASEALVGAIIVMETVSRSAYVYPLVQPLLPSITVSTMDAPLSIIALAAITVTQTESTQQAPLLMASIINRYFTTTTSFGDEVGARDQQSSHHLPKPKIGDFVLKMDELLSSSSEYYDPTSLFGFRRPAIDIGAVDLQQIEEFGDNQAAFGEREIETVMGTKEAEDTAMLLVWRVIVSSLVWNVRSGDGDESCGTDDETNYLSTILKVLVDVEGLFSEVLMWRLQAAASGVQFPPPPPQVPNMIPYKAAFECVLGNLSRQGIDSRSRPLWPLPSFPTSDPFVRFHPIEVVSDLLLSVIGTPVTTATQNSLIATTCGGWGMVEKELGSLTDSLGFQSIPPSVIRALLGSLVSATPLTTSSSMPSTSLACGIPPPPPSTLVALLKLICTDAFLASYGALPLHHHQQRPSSTSTQHEPLIAADVLMSHAASHGQVGGGGGVSLLPSWSEHMVITMVEEFGAVALRHHQALLTSSTSIHPLHAIAHLIRWASACTLQRRQQFTPDVCASLDIVADIVHELGLEPYHLLP